MPGRGPRYRLRDRAPTVRGMAPIPTPPAQPDDATGAYVGLSADTAEQRARERGWSTVRALAPGTVITMEFQSGRINFEVDGGVVRRCWTG